MSTISRTEVYSTFYKNRILPIFSNADPEVVIQVARACAKGGARLFELTNRSESSFEAFLRLKQVVKQERLDLIVGVGSVVDSPTAAQYVNAGACFVVGPLLNPEVARLCNRRKVGYVPGCFTPSEISQAEELGCEFVKYFPADPQVGPGFIKAIKGPCPWVSIVATGGIETSEEALKKWFDAGVSVLGFGSSLLSSKLIEANDWDGLSQNVAKLYQIVNRLSAGK